MSEIVAEPQIDQDQLIEQIVELERSYYFENKGRESDRRRKLKEIIERATPNGQ